jgi:hypothetical protein
MVSLSARDHSCSKFNLNRSTERDLALAINRCPVAEEQRSVNRGNSVTCADRAADAASVSAKSPMHSSTPDQAREVGSRQQAAQKKMLDLKRPDS